MKLLCSEENYKIIEDLLLSNISVQNIPSLTIVEEGFDDGSSSDLKIIFAKDRINELVNLFSEFQSSNSKVETILGLRNDAYKPLDVKSICYFNAINNDVYAHDLHGNEYLVKNKLYQLEEILDSHTFFRINKSELVNMKKISLIKPMFKGKLILYMEGYKNPFDISRNYTKAFKERLGF